MSDHPWVFRFAMAALVFAVLLSAAYSYADNRYRRLNQEKYTPKLQWIDTVMAREKQWILENQGDDGEIYMNGRHPGDINPYFACHAALGLLESTADRTVSDAELQSVRRYLNWHTEQLLASGGQMGTYRKQETAFVRTGKADSMDAYLGAYLELLGAYLEITQSTEGLLCWQDGIRMAVDTLRKLNDSGLTAVSWENNTKYLMDNLEVWKGLRALENGLRTLQDSRELSSIRTRVDSLRMQMETELPRAFWNEAAGKWRVIAGSDQFDPNRFYPDGIAQIYPLICGYPAGDVQAQEALYHAFIRTFHWRTIKADEKTFVWAMAGMAAVQTGDTETLCSFLKTYESTFAANRKYPLYTGEAGWVCRSCAGLHRLYTAQMNRHLFGLFS